MKYAIWFVRLVFVAWMLPAGVNHFIPLFPQPLGNQPLSRELFTALDASHLFDIVKAVELLAGLSLLTGFYVPLALLLCMPVSFCVWYWDVPLQGWGSISAIYGWAVLLCNLLLCLAYLDSYRGMLAPRVPPRPQGAGRARLILVASLIFGGGLLVSGVNHFVVPLYPAPTGHEPLAVQLMSALVHSRLLDVAMAIQLVAGVLILTGFFVPLALCVAMPISVCAAYWAVGLEQQPLGAVLALAALALNGLLMLGYLDAYKGVLQRHATALGETGSAGMSYEGLFVTAGGRTARAPFAGALALLLAAGAFYHFLVFGLPGQWAIVVLLIPAFVLHARRLHDMGRTAWLLLAPGAPIAAALWLYMAKPGAPSEGPMSLIALVVAAGFMLWGLLGKGQAGGNRYGKRSPDGALLEA